jgi:hypothetical protein
MTIKRIVSILLGTLGIKVLAIAGVGNFGERLEQARQTEFFSWFHFEETGRTGKIVHFKPSGEKFRSLVTLNLTIDSSSRLLGAELILSRSFIDSARDGMFARDIAKSFVGMVASAPDLVAEIEQPPANMSTTLLVGKRPAPKLPASPTPGYQVFLGQRQSCQQSPIRLENREVNGVKSLVIAR